MEAPEVRYAKSGDVSIAYSVVGAGPFDLVFVGGWVLSSLEVAWEGPPADFFRGLASFSRLILFDKRGTGLSDRVTGIPDLETRMDDIRAVMDGVGSKRAAIMGFSEGGPMTLLFAATHPEMSAATVLFGTGPSYLWAEDYPWGLTPEQWAENIRRTSARVGTQEWLDERLEMFAPSTADDDATRRWWRRWVLTSASPGAVVALGRMNSEIDARHTLRAIRVPTLVLNRTGDEVNTPAEARYIVEGIPGANFVALPGVDHAFWVNPDQITREVEQFLRGIWDRGEWDVVESDRVLATVLFTDIVGSTAKLAELGDRGWRDLLERHHALVRRQLLRFSGREIDTAATASSRVSTGRPGRSDVQRLSRRACRDSGWTCGPDSTRANARSWKARSGESPYTSAHEWPPKRSRGKCWSPARSRTWLPGPASHSTIAAWSS